MKIEKITITKLFGEYDYEIPLENNKLILVAENGSGKTTIVNLIYFFLSRQWTKLLRYNFGSIGAIVNEKEFSITKQDIDILNSSKFQRYLKRYPSNIKDKIYELLISADPFEIIKNPFKFEYTADRLNIPSHLIFELSNMINSEQLTLFNEIIPSKGKSLENLIDSQILYLPTYRRIEQDLKNIFPDMESDIDKFRKRKRHREPNDSSYVELVEFGMEDVEDKINRRLYEIKEDLGNKIKNNLTGGYLRDVINKTYQNISYEQVQTFNETALSSILSRIDESVLSKQEKNRLLHFVNEVNNKGAIDREENKIVAYFIYRLSAIYKELMDEEKDIQRFVSICNEFSANKKFVYDNINFKITVHPYIKSRIRKKETIELKDLSSGEKQIVSLFSHIYLSREKKFFIIIDEPELSLSVPWQQRFLLDISSNEYCDGILAVTHSPFIFENEMEVYAAALNSFIK
ncbi:AAA family ATPase [Marinifilum sp. D714]|uniref:AAA family ATPase n=1 Tax=Marinifilum sp. D714 TaxID=2937523 RepID=UPI0027CC426F|nr:AAA family ATPase [Marinifilum sp. D714]MDQ2180243.1 ATP-binding protein [Marinifilum sp. D714]